VGLEFELRVLCLQSKCSITWATPPGHFALIILEMGVSQTIGQDWPWTVILLISASQGARTVGVICWHPALTRFLKMSFKWFSYTNINMSIWENDHKPSRFLKDLQNLNKFSIKKFELECLATKCEALSSKSNATKKKKSLSHKPCASGSYL
jgi:hypothetical protein